MSLTSRNSSSTLTKRQENVAVYGWVFGFSVMASLWMIGRWWWEQYMNRQGRGGPDNNNHDDRSSLNFYGIPKKTSRDSSSTDSRPPDLEAAFEQMAQKMRDTDMALSTEDQLLLYALYKQTTVGDAPSVSWSLSFTDQAKHQSWTHLRGLTKEVGALKYIEIATELLQNGGTVDENGSSPQSLETLMGSGVSSRPAVAVDNGPSKSDMTNQQLLLVAAGDNDVGTVRELLKSGVSPDQTDDQGQGQTALHMAADAGALQSMQVLLEQGANATAADVYGISVLQAAVISGHVEVCQLLLTHGANPDQADLDGDTPRNCAMDDGSPEMQALFQDKSSR